MTSTRAREAGAAGRPRGPRWRRGLRRARPLVLAALLLGALSPARAADDASTPSPEALIGALLHNRGPIGAPFDLIDQSGQRRTDADFRGKVVLIYFGYTHCPDVCPMELQSLSTAVDLLGAEAGAVQPVFITIDPERDTPAHLADYVTSFHPRLVALTGASSAIRQVALAYKVYFARSSATQGDDYTVDHTGFVYLVGKDGRYRRFLEPGTPPEKIAAAVRAELRHAD
ncbi:MAG: SCO family protein [Alphaproteobacteria bacterium]|nr:SCO family protein [Alphaproteobacteria bacterium]